jgi:co-chaperonin GroES (HSP10)
MTENKRILNMNKMSQISFINEDEEEAAKKYVEEQLGFPRPRVFGWQMIVMLYTREDKRYINAKGEETLLVVPDTVGIEDRFRSCTALVVSMGQGCYKGEKFKDYGPTCKVGDWITFPRHEGTRVMYRGKTMFYLYDDKVMGPVEDPSHVTRD